MKTNKIVVVLVASLLLISCKNNSRVSPELVKKINTDERLKTVKDKAEELIRGGITAGDSYVEVWIRDLNTFIEAACKVSDQQQIRESLLTFFKFQGENGNIPDGYTTQNTSSIPYDFIHSDLAPEFVAHKNTVETDQESSLIQSISKYIRATGDTSILDEKINERTVSQRMGDALDFLLKERYSKEYGLLWGATTVDWGDVQPEHSWGVYLDSLSHLCIDIYDNAMFLIAIDNYVNLIQDSDEQERWSKIHKEFNDNIRKYLWDEKNEKFYPHKYLENGSPFPKDFNEDIIYYHGGTIIAIEANILSNTEIKTAYKKMQDNVTAANAQTIGLTVYPAYPSSYFKNPWMYEYNYQNGGDWTWFGARMVQQLIEYGFYEEAYEAISPMLDLVITHNGFYEWWSPAGEPMGSSSFRGAAGALWKAITMLEKIN